MHLLNLVLFVASFSFRVASLRALAVALPSFNNAIATPCGTARDIAFHGAGNFTHAEREAQTLNPS